MKMARLPEVVNLCGHATVMMYQSDDEGNMDLDIAVKPKLTPLSPLTMTHYHYS